jgi:hypothetical protein
MGSRSLRWATAAMVVVGILGLLAPQLAPRRQSAYVTQPVRIKPPPPRAAQRERSPVVAPEDDAEGLEEIGYLGNEPEPRTEPDLSDERWRRGERRNEEPVLQAGGKPVPKRKKVSIPDPEPADEIITMTSESPLLDEARVADLESSLKRLELEKGQIPKPAAKAPETDTIGSFEESLTVIEESPPLEERRIQQGRLTEESQRKSDAYESELGTNPLLEGEEARRFVDQKQEAALMRERAASRETLYRGDGADRRDPSKDDRDDLPTARDPRAVAGQDSGVAGDRANVGGDESGAGGAFAQAPGPVELDPREIARSFLAERGRIEGVASREASGYWSNRYVPGDPALRLLDARLRRVGRTSLERHALEPLLLHDAARQPAQPFDLHADRAGLADRGRMLVQVGLQATDRHAGRRGAMNVAVVLDLGYPTEEETAIAMRSLVRALAEARDGGDRFHLIGAGYAGGTVLGPDDFRHGPLMVAMDGLLEDFVDDEDSIEWTSREDALALALERVSRGDDPDTPLGSSVVLLVTDGALGTETLRLSRLAHLSAVAGVPVSVVGVGDRVVSRELDRVALAGQGNRRLLQRASEAEALVERELASVSQVVARALRLRIRLAPGVELIDVIGSERLDEAGAERVREAEQSIDRRLARNLGIEADRGEDEEGIQIVIPSFQAGDSHVVLLDVVAPGPGPIAHVTLRYKDLLYLRNGTARASLGLLRDERPPGALETNVLQNLLAHRLYEALDTAGSALAEGDAAVAERLLSEARALFVGLPLELPGLERDAGLERDVEMLTEYIALLDAGASGDAGDRLLLADSLRFAGRLKVLPRPVESLASLQEELPDGR